eukprot:CAMPEP_0185584174 /NCGR_PEP_ID=MMETSP0434-20130131/30578_1 /TAXON_ID=626734 ORGANISM="Favella taraikaensis, Strain Fe Narragansett Bay" /NCGR_SAMPLE_ID=MMETSP0434 /ASSEMBLY_ACC=CAM_ASM_000379 /LENGTH=226 /DNA_ID=CAMNT_0028203763 /DNA_START=124 /DNA_END=801 /DNA_ORIENTATION=-
MEKGIWSEFLNKERPTVLCLNETKTSVDRIDESFLYTQIPTSYAQYWNCSTVRKGYSGTAIFSKVEPLSVAYDFGSKHVDEGRSITAEFSKFTLVVVYVPNSQDHLRRLDYRINEWDAEFHAYLRSLEKSKKKPVIVTGDFNVAHRPIDIYDTTNKEKVAGFTPQERHSFDQLLKSGFSDTYRDLYPESVKYSFWSMRQRKRATNEGWRLDYFLMSQQAKSGIELL